MRLWEKFKSVIGDVWNKITGNDGNTDFSTDAGGPAVAGLSLAQKFNRASADYEAGKIDLDIIDTIGFKICSGLAKLFNKLNFFGLTSGLTGAFQRAALNIVKEEWQPTPATAPTPRVMAPAP